MSRRRRIAIVGAGPAGLTAALFLTRSGNDVTVYERFDAPAPVGSGLILQPTGLTVLAELGLLPKIFACGARIDRLHGADAKTGRTVLDVRYSASAGGRFGIGIHRAALFQTLYDAVLAANITIISDCAVERIEQVGSASILFSETGDRVGEAELVVDASGARSKLRAALAPGCVQRPLAYGAWWTSLEWRADGFDPHALLQRYDRASVMIGVLPIGRMEPQGKDMAAFFWSMKPDEVSRTIDGGIDAWKDRILGYWPECEAYTSQIAGFDQLTLARYGHHTLVPAAGDNWAVIGDAAHSTSPQLGQGANMALLDAAAIAAALDGCEDNAQALSRYARMRARHVRVFQALSLSLTPFYQSDSRILPFFRDRLVALAAQIPPAPQLLAAMVAGTIVDPFAPIGLGERDWSEFAAADTRR